MVFRVIRLNSLKLRGKPWYYIKIELGVIIPWGSKYHMKAVVSDFFKLEFMVKVMTKERTLNWPIKYDMIFKTRRNHKKTSEEVDLN